MLIIAGAVISLFEPYLEDESGKVLRDLCLRDLCMNQGVRIAVCSTNILLSLLTMTLPLYLVYIHTGNYAANKTTTERFSRGANSRAKGLESASSVSLLSKNREKKNRCCGNCRTMCWPAIRIPD